MLNIFKERLKAEEAAVVYLKALSTIIEKTWEIDVTEINELADYTAIATNEYHAQFELFLAVVALELNVVMNLKPEKYNIIYKSLLVFLENVENTGKYAIGTINDEYIPAIKRSELDGLPPYNDLLYILIEKIGIEEFPFLPMLLSKIIVSKLGSWKSIFTRYNVI